MNITEEDAAMAYYREMAAPLLVPFPKRSRPPSTDPHPEGLDVWDVGRPLEKIDWLESVLRGPAVIPGFTTVERLEGEAPGKEKAEKPLLLDIYIDSSGSISNPRQNFSPLCLAGAILALSALRAGSRVRAVLWSGPGQVKPTNGFTRDQKDIFSVLTGYYGGGTAFPLLNMKEFYFNPSEKHRLLPGERVHILVISDEGVDTMLSEAEGMPEGKTVISSILDKAGGGGSLVLNLYQKGWVKSPAGKRFSEQGWVVTPMQSWEDTVSFARDFSKRTWGDKNG